jgi:RNA polymerase sigma-70 factor (ECF subfamily)
VSRDRHLAEDLTQEAFLKALAHLETFRSGTNFRAWLFRIAHNSWVNHARRPRCPGGREQQPCPEHLPGREEGPLEQVLNREALQLLARAVSRLPAEFRAAFLLRAEEGLSFRQIADVLGLTEETARWRVFKARQTLLRVLAPELEHKDR